MVVNRIQLMFMLRSLVPGPCVMIVHSPSASPDEVLTSTTSPTDKVGLSWGQGWAATAWPTFGSASGGMSQHLGWLDLTKPIYNHLLPQPQDQVGYSHVSDKNLSFVISPGHYRLQPILLLYSMYTMYWFTVLNRK